jgi:hypothetical protein
VARKRQVSRLFKKTGSELYEVGVNEIEALEFDERNTECR